ncbi:hypothetical protein E4U42_003289 [Claviceps africana]|uniref:Uncharacterized protein n=1 Tax=Claviceps africana TaxID=83212 RepID=A0A8K0NHY7_9HYPO|nr:hypothetical protein E4U42_003289 [Claviceps africana]
MCSKGKESTVHAADTFFLPTAKFTKKPFEMCPRRKERTVHAVNNPLTCLRIRKKLAFVLMEKFGAIDGMRLHLEYNQRRCNAWKKYDMKRETLRYTVSKNQKAMCPRTMDRKWQTAPRDVVRRRGLGFSRTMISCSHECRLANRSRAAMKKRIKMGSGSSHQPQADMDRIKHVLVEKLQRLDDEYIAMLEQKAIGNESIR